MTLSVQTFLIVCPLVFLAGFVDAIGGGGGLISLPAYMLGGLPTHMAVATNKLSSCCGTALTTVQFFRRRLIHVPLGLFTIVCAVVGSGIGSSLSLRTDEAILKKVLLPVLLVAAFFVLNKNLFGRSGTDAVTMDRRTICTAGLSALIIGAYDGFYGPGTGTFLIIALNVFAGFSVMRANAQTKVINLTTNITSLLVFIRGGQVVWILGLTAALFNMAGNYLGARLALEHSERITRPVILMVLTLLAVKIITG